MHSLDDTGTPEQRRLLAQHLGQEHLRELRPVLMRASTPFRERFFAHLARIGRREGGPRAIALALACTLYDEERTP